jgi:hypothetical protein
MQRRSHAANRSASSDIEEILVIYDWATLKLPALDCGRGQGDMLVSTDDAWAAR